MVGSFRLAFHVAVPHESDLGLYLVRLFDVMEARHTEGKFFTEVELVTIMTDVCEGVSTLHQHRPPIAHRDIKGEDFFFDMKSRGEEWMLN